MDTLGYYALLLVFGSLLFIIIYQIVKTYFPKQSYDKQNEVKVNTPPGSRGLPLIGETLQFMSAINSSNGFYDFVRIRRLRYGDCFKTNIFGETQVFVSTTDSVKAILSNIETAGNFTKKYMKPIAKLLGNQSLLCADQNHHKFLRSRLSNLFSVASVSSFIKDFDELIIENLQSWEYKSCVMVLDEALKITCKAMCKMLMSIEKGHELELLQKEVGRICEAMLSFPLNIPGTRFYRGLQARQRIMRIIEKVISERRRGLGVEHEDFLQRLLMKDGKAFNATNTKLTDSEIKDNILTMIIAGQDTTASAITWMVKFLDENKEVLQMLRNEQFHLAKKRKQTILTLEDLNEMPYASKIVKESLRMASIVPWLPRLVQLDCEINGFRINGGWNINIDARSMHFDPTIYKDPSKFNPSRFDDESKPYSFLAFGMGGRTCLGMNLAKSMMLVFLHRLITLYRWKVINKDSSIEKWAMFSRLRSGCPVIVTRTSYEETDHHW